ncbi:MAG: hypothetical protein IKL48_05000 [Elusimicrobiaceae bacterium]|nr:hypothetical protein [Elusimicrobiaceae bacterium]
MSKKEKKQKKESGKKRSKIFRFAKGTISLFFRTLLFTVMFLFLLLMGLWIAAQKMFNAQQISELLVHQLQELFDRPVVITSLDLKFLNTVQLNGFAVLDTEVLPSEPFIAAESVTIRYKILPLLEHKLIIDEVTLNRPRISVVRGPDGNYNVPPVRAAETQKNFVSQTTGEKIDISIEDWRIHDGVLSYKDLGRGVSHAVYGLDVHFPKLKFDELSRFRMETVLRNRWGENISDLEIRGNGQVNFANFDWSKFALRNFKTQVSLFQKPVSLTLDLDNLRTPFFNILLSAPAFDNQDLSVFHKNLPTFRAPTSKISARGVLTEGYSFLTINELTSKTDNLNFTLSGKADFSAKPIKAEFNLKTAWNDLAILSKRWPSLSRFAMKGKGALSASVKREKGKFSLPLVEISTKGVSGDFWGFLVSELDGSFVAKKDFTDLYVQTTNGQVKVADTLFDALKMTGSYRKGDVYAFISSALLNQVPLKMRLSIDNIKSKKRNIDTSIYLQNFEPMKFIATVMDFVEVILEIPKKKHKPLPVQTGDLAWMRNFRDRLPQFMPNFSGTLFADTFTSTVLSGNRFNAEFAFTNMVAGAKELNGTLDMKLEEGIIHQMEKLAEEQQALNITFTPFIMMHRMERSGSFKVGEVLKDVAFNEMAGSVDFKNGTMIINNAFTQGPVISAAVSGWVDWVRENFELVIWTMFTPSSKKGGILAENLTDESGNPALAFKVSSSMLKPKLEMLRAKKTKEQIDTARRRGLRTDFNKSRDFLKGEFNAKK